MLNIIAQTITSSPTYTNTQSTSVSPLLSATFFIPFLLILLIVVISQWKIFEKAGKPGWASIIPVYNSYVLFEITGYPAWLAILLVIPFVNFIAGIVGLLASFKLAKLFGKSDAFAVMNVLFPFITYPILGFGKAQFQGTDSTMPSATSVNTAAPVIPATPLYPTPNEPTTFQPNPVSPQAPVTPDLEAPSPTNPTPPVA